MSEDRFFEVMDPIRVWRQLGHSLSNDWVGSSRVMGTVREARNLARGDEILLRPIGPLYAVHDGKAWVISLKEPAPFASRKLHQDRSRDVVLQLAAAGKLAERHEPRRRIDHGAAVLAVTANVLPPLHPGTVVVEASPELEQAMADARDAMGPWTDRGMAVTLRPTDSGHDGPAKVALSSGGCEAEIMAFPDGLSRIRFPGRLAYAGEVTFRGVDTWSYVDARTQEERQEALEGIAAAFARALDFESIPGAGAPS